MNAGTMRLLVSELANRPDAEGLFTSFTTSQEAVRATLPILGSTVAVRAVPDATGYMVGFVALNAAALKWLNDVFITKASVGFDAAGNPMHTLERGVAVGLLSEAIVRAAGTALALRRQEEAGDFAPGSTVAMHWYSAKFNFGDWIGPQLVQAYTGRQPVQSDRPGVGGRVLYSVGSILHRVTRNNVDVWGSGLMRPLTAKEIEVRSALKGVKIHAVRGKETRRELQESLGWDVPEVYGDPALLLPDIIHPAEAPHGQVAVVPHYVHLPQLDLQGIGGRLVDVRGDVKTVVEQLAGASAVVSSSLHGLIVAQAYGVPWVWLDVTDHQLGGKDFKFEDFFTCLDRNAVSRVRISKEQLATTDLAAFAAQATLPELHIDLELLRDALPVAPAEGPLRGQYRAEIPALR